MVRTCMRWDNEAYWQPAQWHDRRSAGTVLCAGVLLCGCSPEVREQLASAFAGNSKQSSTTVAESTSPAVEKEYLALVEGRVQTDHGVIRTPIGRVAYGVRGGLHAATPDGKACESRWRLVHFNPDGTSLVAVTIRTGGSEPRPITTRVRHRTASSTRM